MSSRDEPLISPSSPHGDHILPSPVDVIPHRAPFLFLDRVTSCEERAATGHYQFSPQDPLFEGHFPERPIVPGVLLAEGAAQLLAYWALLKRPGHWVLLTGIDRAKWSREVIPGDQLTYHVEITRAKLGLVVASARVLCGEEVAMTAQIKGYLQMRSASQEDVSDAER